MILNLFMCITEIVFINYYIFILMGGATKILSFDFLHF